MYAALLATALAADPTPGVDEAADMELVVQAAERVAAARGALDRDLEALGYPFGVRLGDRVVYARTQRWKPRVTLWDDGRVRVKARRASLLAIVPVRTEVRSVFLFAGRRTVQRMESRVFGALEADLVAWRDALAEEGLRIRLAELGPALHAVWAESTSPAAARSTLVAMWRHTADNDAGQRVRDRIAGFVDDVVQASGSPFTPEEVATANAVLPFTDEFAPR